jgi:hypothetical protein
MGIILIRRRPLAFQLTIDAARSPSPFAARHGRRQGNISGATLGSNVATFNPSRTDAQFHLHRLGPTREHAHHRGGRHDGGWDGELSRQNHHGSQPSPSSALVSVWLFSAGPKNLRVGQSKKQCGVRKIEQIVHGV